MLFDIPQFTEQKYCLDCRECCIFRHEIETWLARASSQEVARIEKAYGLKPEEVVQGRWLKTLERDGEYRCALLDEPQHHCRIYSERPVECALYPFLLSSEPEGVKVLAHEACPFVQDKLGSSEWEAHVQRLRSFFSRSDVRQYLRETSAIFSDYSSYGEEVRDVFMARATFPEELLKQKARFEERVAQQGVVLSSMAFADLFVWHDAFDLRFEEIAGTLCVFASQPVGEFLLLPPLGPEAAVLEAVDLAFERMRSHTASGGLARVENVPEAMIDLFSQERFIVSERGVDHIYERKAIAELKGNALKSQRHDVNLAQKGRELIFRPYVSADRGACEQLFDRWLDSKKKKSEDSLDRMTLEDARISHACLWEHAQDLGLVGRVVQMAGDVVAYTFGYALAEDVFCVLAEVADPSVKGLAAYTFNSLARDPKVVGYRYLNAMGGQGLSGLARAKMLWHPVKQERIYSVREK